MECAQMTLNEWVEMKQRIRQELIGVKRSFVRIGYMLRKIDDQKGYEQDGYKSIAEFAQKELGLHPSTTTRFMEINREYSIDGYSERLREEYEDLSRSQLEEMLKLPEEDRKMIEPVASRESIRELKRFNQSMPENETVAECNQIDSEGQQADPIDTVIENFFTDNPDLLCQTFQAIESGSDTKELVEIINPGGNRSYRKGTYFLMMYENKISFKQFGGSPQQMTWEEFFQKAKGVFGESWRNYFEPVEEEKTEPENPNLQTEEEPIAPAQKLEENQEIQKSEENEQLPGQMDVNDFPELIPKEKEQTMPDLKEPEEQTKEEASKEEPKEPIAPAQESEEITEKTELEGDSEKANEITEDSSDHSMNPPEVIEKPFGSRKDWFDTLTAYGAATELARLMEGIIHESIQDITKVSFWEQWLNEEVDDHGRKIEEA